MKRAVYCLNRDSYSLIYGPEERAEFSRRLEIAPEIVTKEEVIAHPELLEGVEILLSGWGCVPFTREVLEHAKQMELILYAAGSIRYITPPEFWRSGIRICSAWAANAVPVAEYTLGQILLGLKAAHANAREVRAGRAFRGIGAAGACPGLYGSTVGLVSLGMIGRMVAEKLRSFDVHVVAYDPYVSQEKADALGVQMVSLEEVFRVSDVVSVHTPWLPETEGLIGGEHFRVLKPYATFINTSRGAVVRENELVETLRARPDLTAVLDVTHPEPPEPDSPLYTLENVVLTSHIAGSQNRECRRMARYMLAELDRYLSGKPLQWEVNERLAQTLA